MLRDLCETMKFGSLCALGGFIPFPVMSALTHFPDDFRRTPPSTSPAEHLSTSPAARERSARFSAPGEGAAP